MRAALLCLILLALPNLARAENADAEEKAQVAVNAVLDTCLNENPRDTSCIGEAVQTCIMDDTTPVEADWFVPTPFGQIFEWCTDAERNAWQSRLMADIQEIRDLVPAGPAQREIEEQQRAWASFDAKSFPYNRFGPDEIWKPIADSSLTPLVAIRSLQVGFILDQVRFCMPEGMIRDSSVCKYMNTSP